MCSRQQLRRPADQSDRASTTYRFDRTVSLDKQWTHDKKTSDWDIIREGHEMLSIINTYRRRTSAPGGGTTSRTEAAGGKAAAVGGTAAAAAVGAGGGEVGAAAAGAVAAGASDGRRPRTGGGSAGEHSCAGASSRAKSGAPGTANQGTRWCCGCCCAHPKHSPTRGCCSATQTCSNRTATDSRRQRPGWHWRSEISAERRHHHTNDCKRSWRRPPKTEVSMHQQQ